MVSQRIKLLILATSLLVFIATKAGAYQCAQHREMDMLVVLDHTSSMQGSPMQEASGFAADLFQAMYNTGHLNRRGFSRLCNRDWDYSGMDYFNIADLNAFIMEGYNLALYCTGSQDYANHPWAIVVGAEYLFSYSSNNTRLLVIITNSPYDADVYYFDDALDGLQTDGLIAELIHIGGGSTELQQLANQGGPNAHYRQISASQLSGLIPTITAYTCANYRPNASFSISDSNLMLGVEGCDITFNGSASGDAETSDSGLTFQWTFTRPDGTNFTRQGISTTTVSFNDTQLPHGEDWGVELRVTDPQGASDTQFQSFRVIGSPPQITINGPTTVDVLDSIYLEVTPKTDVDGLCPGTLDPDLGVVWSIDQSPSLGPQSNFATGTEINYETTVNDIGTWVFRATATDNEVEQGSAEITVEVQNRLPVINVIDVGPKIAVGELVWFDASDSYDPDGGELSFRWDVLQAPLGAVPNVGEDVGPAAPYYEIATDYSHAGTWIVRLVVTDDEGQPESKEFTVLVDARPLAKIKCLDCTDPGATERGTIGSLSFPLELDGSSSIDPDSPPPPPCPGFETDYCHNLWDKPQAIISPGINLYEWSLVDVTLANSSPGSQESYPAGRVDEVFGVSADESSFTLDFGDLEPGIWTFQLRVRDGDGNGEYNEDFETFTVTVVDANGPPMAVINGPARYTTDPLGNLSQDILLSGHWSYDLDNLLVGDPFGPRLGISDYRWIVVDAPPGCDASSRPSEPDQPITTLYNSGDFVDPICHGMWNIQLTDDDSPAKTDSAETTVIIGNCVGMLCIDSPTTQFPEFIEFTNDTDIFIYYHLDSALYDDHDSIFASGLLTILEIFHESDLTTPVYTSYDPSVLASDKGGFLVYRWNGYSNTYQRPQPGKYTVKITLLDSTFSVTPSTDVEAEAIWIAVAEPSILSTSDRYIDFNALESRTDTITLDYEILGSAVPDELKCKVFNDSNQVVYESSISPSISRTIDWNGQIADPADPTGPTITIPAGEYTAQIEAYQTGSLLGKSNNHQFFVIRLDLDVDTNLDGLVDAADESIERDAPGRIIWVNGDDDNTNGIVDKNESSSVSGENDLAEIIIRLQPQAITGTVSLLAVSGGPNVRVWDSADKSVEIILDKVFVLGSDTIPSSLYIEGISEGEIRLSLTYKDEAGNVVSGDEIFFTIIHIDLDVDTDRNGIINDSDEDNEDIWSGARGAIILCNNDNDDKPLNSDIDKENSVIDGTTDVNDLAELLIHKLSIPSLPVGWEVKLVVLNDHDKIHIFDKRSPSGSLVLGPPPVTNQFVIPDVISADLSYGIESLQYPDVGFNPALIKISLILSDSTGPMYQDTVQVRVAPFTLSSNIDPVNTVYVVHAPTDPDSDAFVTALEPVVVAAGATLVKIDATSYLDGLGRIDQWAQDQFEFGHSQLSSSYDVVLDSLRNGGLPPYPENELLGPNFGYVTRGAGPNSLDSFGNLECSPPVTIGGTNYNLGRIIYGGNPMGRQMNAALRAFLNAQFVQAPLEIDSDWLRVGHVDEFISFVPFPLAPAGGKRFKLLMAKPAEAIAILEAQPNPTVVIPKLGETIGDIVTHDKAFNLTCQAKIDAVRSILKAQLNLQESDIVDIPVLFREEPPGSGKALAWLPDMVNLLCVNNHLIVAEPFFDPFKNAFNTRLSGIGFVAPPSPGADIHYIDDWNFYHILEGEVHCGTNSRRDHPVGTFWWDRY